MLQRVVQIKRHPKSSPGQSKIEPWRSQGHPLVLKSIKKSFKKITKNLPGALQNQAPTLLKAPRGHPLGTKTSPAAKAQGGPVLEQPPGDAFGSLLGSIFPYFSQNCGQFVKPNVFCFGDAFWTPFWILFDLIWGQFRGKKISKNRVEFSTVSGTDFGIPRAPS